MPQQQIPPSPFFRPSTPRSVVQVVRIQQSPGGSKHRIASHVNKSTTHEAKSTITACAANLTNAIVGSGIVGIPFAVSQAGLVAGVVLIVGCAILTEKSLRLLVATAKHAHTASYETVAEAAFGVAGFQFVAANMFIMAYGAMLSYLMIVKDVFPTLLQMTDVYRSRAVLWVVSSCVILPLSCQRDMANLSFTSRLSVVLDVCLVALVAYNAPLAVQVEETMGGWQHAVSQDWIKPETIFVGLGVLSFAFVCQHSAFLIAGSLHNPTVARWSLVTRCSLVFCCILALCSGLFGYLGYGDDTQGNILRNLPHNISSSAARGMLGTTMLFVYPMECFVARHVCVALLFSGRRAHEGNDDSDLLQRWDRRVGLTVSLFLLSIVPASIFDDLGPVLALTGAVGGSSLCYLGPGGVYLGVHGERFLQLMDESLLFGRWHRQYWTTQQEEQKPEPTAMAQETTPLVAGNIRSKHEPSPLVPNGQQQQEQQQQDEDCSFCTRALIFFQTLLACLLLMPLWCAIAARGKECLTRHMHNLALKSPHPLRIGDVEYKRMTIEYDADEEVPSGPLFYDNASSLPTTPNLSLRGGEIARDMTSINQQIGKQLVLQQKKTKSKRKTTTTEPDPQEDPPAWGDFVIAIAYCLLGVVALVAGLFSLAVEVQQK